MEKANERVKHASAPAPAPHPTNEIKETLYLLLTQIQFGVAVVVVIVIVVAGTVVLFLPHFSQNLSIFALRTLFTRHICLVRAHQDQTH